MAEDHNIVRNGIRSLLEKEKDFDIVGEASNGLEALNKLDSGIDAQIVLLDINMPEMGGLELIKKLKERNSKIIPIVLTMLDNENYISQAFVAGASGYLLKSVSADELIFALRHICSGGKYLCSELSFTLLDRLIYTPEAASKERLEVELSKREIEVLCLIAEGFTNMEIADKLFTSKRTVEGHRLGLLNKTSSRNSAALIKYAILNGIIN